jgi:hypothetical protein
MTILWRWAAAEFIFAFIFSNALSFIFKLLFVTLLRYTTWQSWVKAAVQVAWARERLQ